MATKKPKGLGRGLEALLGPRVEDSADATPTTPGQPASLLLADMVPGVYQPRTRMDEGALYELAESIKSQGIMQPILVRKLASGANAASTKSSRASGAFARRVWRAWTACRCWCVTSPTKPRPPWP